MSPRVTCLVAMSLAATATPLAAQTAEQRIEQLERTVAEQDARIRQLEALVRAQAGLAAAPAGSDPAAAASAAAPGPAGSPPVALAAAAPPSAGPALGAPGSPLQLSGDVRVRYEANMSDRDARDRHRGVFRARLGASYRIADFLSVGAQLVTGDPDDPNSADLSLSNFDDNLNVSLDQAYARFHLGSLTVDAGKIPQVFRRTDLVWDGDVSPQGVSARYSLPVSAAITLDGRALYFLIDESVAGPDSDMIGGQIALTLRPADAFEIALAAGYFDYALRSVAGADGGDFRSNLLAPDGSYLSDFDLVDIIGSLRWSGLGEAWPLLIEADYVRNTGAAVDADTGFSVSAALGRASRPGDWRFAYNYAFAETDAVLAAFSQDNIGVGTNYLLHALSVDFVPREHVLLNATLYRYRPKSAIDAGPNAPDDWLNRLRFNLTVDF